MSLYNFAPCSRYATQNVFSTWQNLFTEEELDAIVKICDKLEIEKGVIARSDEGDELEKIRKSDVAWLDNNPETGWIYDRLAYVGRKLNSQFYGFDLYGFVEHMQYTVYNGDGGHYTWHADIGDTDTTRKLTLVLQLSDPDDYEGGTIEVQPGSSAQQVDKERGLVCAFPSWMLHRVTPVESGIRKTLVVWIAGPDFK